MQRWNQQAKSLALQNINKSTTWRSKVYRTLQDENKSKGLFSTLVNPIMLTDDPPAEDKHIQMLRNVVLSNLFAVTTNGHSCGRSYHRYLLPLISLNCRRRSSCIYAFISYYVTVITFIVILMVITIYRCFQKITSTMKIMVMIKMIKILVVVL